MPVQPPVQPPVQLAPGARVALVAPAGPLRGPADVQAGEANARALGWEPVVGRHVLGRVGYLAGADAERLADLRHALADPAIDAVWCLRGGYGVLRLLDRIDWAAFARRPKPLLGFSDVTALLAAAGRAGAGAYHAPVARNPLPPFSAASLCRAVVECRDPCAALPTGVVPRALRAGTAEGRLAGGNLALLAALCGTPYFPDLDGAILVLEDVHEAAYRVDRMLHQLQLAGVLRGVRALAIGQFTDVAPHEDGELPLDALFTELADALGVPCLTNLPVGHVDEQWTLPLGAPAVLDADAGRLTVRW